MGICKSYDEFMIEKLHWIVVLSNDEVILQDDNRPGEDPPQAWLRLLAYLNENDLGIKTIQIRFCSHIETISPASFAGVFFTQAVEGFASIKRTYRYYIFGFVLDEVLHCTRWLVPEILPISNETRLIPYGDEKLWLK